MNRNPLLDFSGLPRFDAIQPADVAPAIGELLREPRELVARLTDAGVPTGAAKPDVSVTTLEDRH